MITLDDVLSEEQQIIWKKFILETNWLYVLNFYEQNNSNMTNFFNQMHLPIECYLIPTQKNGKYYTSISLSSAKCQLFILCSFLTALNYSNFFKEFEEIKEQLVDDFFSEVAQAIRVYAESNKQTDLTTLLQEVDIADLLNKVWLHLQESKFVYKNWMFVFSSTDEYFLELKITHINNSTVCFVRIDSK